MDKDRMVDPESSADLPFLRPSEATYPFARALREAAWHPIVFDGVKAMGVKLLAGTVAFLVAFIVPGINLEQQIAVGGVFAVAAVLIAYSADVYARMDMGTAVAQLEAKLAGGVDLLDVEFKYGHVTAQILRDPIRNTGGDLLPAVYLMFVDAKLTYRGEGTTSIEAYAMLGSDFPYMDNREVCEEAWRPAERPPEFMSTPLVLSEARPTAKGTLAFRFGWDDVLLLGGVNQVSDYVVVRFRDSRTAREKSVNISPLPRHEPDDPVSASQMFYPTGDWGSRIEQNAAVFEGLKRRVGQEIRRRSAPGNGEDEYPPAETKGP